MAPMTPGGILRRLFRTGRFAKGGVIPTPLNPGDVPFFLSGGRVWLRDANGEWCETRDPLMSQINP